MLHPKLKSCTEVLRYHIESQLYPLLVLAITAKKLWQLMPVIAMRIAEMITKRDREHTMPEKDPSNYSLLTYLWIFFLAGWGGLVSFLAKVKAGETRYFNFSELIGELVTAAFTGMITFWFCELAGFKPLLTAAFVGVAGHMGSRLMFQFEKALQRKFEFVTTAKPDSTPEQKTDNGEA